MIAWRHFGIVGIAVGLAGVVGPPAWGQYPAGPYSAAPYPAGPPAAVAVPSGGPVAPAPGTSVWPSPSPPPAAGPGGPSSSGPWTPAGATSPPADSGGQPGPLLGPDFKLLQPAAVACAPEGPPPSSWYTRVDYFHWNERMGGQDFVNESGALYTLGYVHRSGQERFRIEAFGGDMRYAGYEENDDGSLGPPLGGRTDYLGCRGEYDLLFEPKWWSQGTFLLGIGSRFWVRDIQSGFDNSGNFVAGYQETWWTFYPYLGLETKQPVGRAELYTASHIGVTPFAYNKASDVDSPIYPRTGLAGQVELGLRAGRLSVAGYFEGLTWGHSKTVMMGSEYGVVDVMQPDSRMYTVGGKIAYAF
ncbi:MAG: hypothetical protein ABSG86_26500 [Thermoguttaceae bacterium]